MNRDKHSMTGARRSKRKKRDGLAKLRKKKAERFGGRDGGKLWVVQRQETE